MAFTFSLNNLYASQQECLYRFKEKLIANGWVVQDSGTGTAGGYGSGTDIITTFSTTTDAVAGAITNRSAWFRIQSPDTVRELIVQHSVVNTATDNIGIRYSPSAKFLGTGDGTVGASIAPTATDEFVIMGDRRPISGGNGISFANGNTGNFRMDFIFGGAAENYCFFAAMRVSAGTGAYVGGMLFDRLTNTVSGDPDSTVLWSLGEGGASANFITNSSKLTDGRSYWSYGTAGVSGDAVMGARMPFGVPVRNTPRIDSANSWHILWPTWQNITGGLNLLNPGGANPYDSEIDLIEPVYWACTTLAPASALGSLGSPSPFGVLKGTSQIIKAISTNAGYSAMDTNTALTRVAQLGGFWLLWDGSTTPIL